MDQASLLTALTVFLLSAGPDVCAVEPLHSLCLQRFTSVMEAKEPLVSAAAAAAASSPSDPATPNAPFGSTSLLKTSRSCREQTPGGCGRSFKGQI